MKLTELDLWEQVQDLAGPAKEWHVPVDWPENTEEAHKQAASLPFSTMCGRIVIRPSYGFQHGYCDACGQASRVRWQQPTEP